MPTFWKWLDNFIIVSPEISISGEVLFNKITHRSSLEGEVKEMIFVILNSPKLVMSIFIYVSVTRLWEDGGGHCRWAQGQGEKF